MTILRFTGLLGGLAVLLGHGTIEAAEKSLVLHPPVWEAYQEYADLQRPGAFAVSRDGSVYGYSYCPEVRCKFHTTKKVALESCVENGGADCVIFAFQRDIRVEYSVLDLEVTGACPAAPVPRVTIIADIPAATYDYTHDVKSLTEFEKLGRARAGAVNFELLGLAVHEFQSSAANDLRPYIREAEGLICAGFETGEIRLRMSSQIFVANDFPKGTCLHREILKHEERHHEVARRLFAALAADATRRLAKDLDSRPFIQVADPWQGRSASQARLDRAIDAAYAEFIRRYEIEQSEIDTTAEYTRIAKACPDAERYLD